MGGEKKKKTVNVSVLIWDSMSKLDSLKTNGLHTKLKAASLISHFLFLLFPALYARSTHTTTKKAVQMLILIDFVLNIYPKILIYQKYLCKK